MDDLRRPNGAVLVEPSVQSHSSSPDLTSSLRSATFLIEPEVWPQAERVTQEIITWVQPTVTSEEKRKEVIEYVQRLFRTRLGCEVYPFGSVPLKTYLPDGDIDLTAFCHFSSEESLAGEVSSMLVAEDTNPAAECIVKDVHTIRAEVRLVKCLVENIVVDISFNQIGGLCTLCFLEEVDRLIGKDHLFKRSIILIKAWCYYESRILGAHHGLISTYALETLVLYIFHLFHMSLNGPLSVLYKFLHYYSKFDWESYGVSLHGPVHISSLPEIVAEKPDNGGGDLLLKEDFLRKCVNMYSVPSRGAEISSKSHPKFLNIIDPLKENNNLGRSVSKGNFFRIRSAFAYGARKLGQILSQPQNNIGQEVQKFFTNSLERHRVHWYDSQDPLDITGPNGFAPEMSISSTCPSPSDASKDGSLTPSLGRLNGDAKDQATSCLQISATKPDISKSSLSTSKESKPICAPHLFFSRPLDTEKMDNGDLDEAVVCSSSRKVRTSQTRGGDHNSSSELENRNSSKNHDFPASSGTKDVTTTAVTPDASCFDNLDCTPFRKRQSAGGGGPPETLMLLSHLSGDYDSQYSSLQYGRRWFEFASSVSVQAMHMPMQPPIFHHEVPWDAVQRPMHFRPMPYMNVNDVMMTRPAYPMSSALFPMEEGAKSRGTGTYLPVMIHDSYRDRSSPRGKNPGPLRSPHNNGRGGYARGRDSHMRSSSAPGQYIFHQYGGMAPYEDWYYEAESSSPRGRTYKDSNGPVCTEKGVEIVSGGGSVPWEASSVTADKTSQPHPVAASVGQSSGNGGLNNTKGTEVVNPVCTASNAERLAGKSLRIKDEDFPPLSAR